MLSEQTIGCKFCGKPYKVYSHLAGDQSCCPDCRKEAKSTIGSQSVKCPICGRLYAFYSHYAGDQSACPNCVAQAELNWNNKWDRFWPRYRFHERVITKDNTNVYDCSAISYELEI